MANLFVSDLHLSTATPALADLYVGFLRQRVHPGDTLYVLGDLFEAWLGDDAATAEDRRVMDAMRAASDAGAHLFFMHGNRDFLAGEGFEAMTGCRILQEPTVVSLRGESVLLMHGDSLCTDDHEYMSYKARVRQPAFMKQFLALPIAQRQAIAESFRAESARSTRRKPMEIMDVNPGTVEETMRSVGVHRMIHGHTHRQAIHDFMLDGAPAQRIVLGDWHETGCVLTVDEDGYRLENFTLAELQ